MVSIKRARENPSKIHNKTEINNLPDQVFKALMTRMLTEFGKRVEEHRILTRN